MSAGLNKNSYQVQQSSLEKNTINFDIKNINVINSFFHSVLKKHKYNSTLYASLKRYSVTYR